MLVTKGDAASAGGVEFPVTGIEDVVLAALEARGWRDVPDHAVQPDGSVVRDVAGRHPKPAHRAAHPVHDRHVEKAGRRVGITGTRRETERPCDLDSRHGGAGD